jgi:BolA protein
MNINQLILIVTKKINKNILLESINIEDKTFLHKNHKSNQDGKFHLKLTIMSQELKKMNKIQSTKKIYSILDEELKKYIHSIQILII